MLVDVEEKAVNSADRRLMATTGPDTTTQFRRGLQTLRTLCIQMRCPGAKDTRTHVRETVVSSTKPADRGGGGGERLHGGPHAAAARAGGGALSLVGRRPPGAGARPRRGPLAPGRREPPPPAARPARLGRGAGAGQPARHRHLRCALGPRFRSAAACLIMNYDAITCDEVGIDPPAAPCAGAVSCQDRHNK